MRIAVFHNLPSGGAKRTLAEAIGRLATRHQVDVYTLSCAEHAFADIRQAVTSHDVCDFESLPLLRSPWGRANQILRAADLLRLSRVARHIARRIEREKYDVVLAHPCRFEQSPSVLRFLGRTPSAYYCHEPLRLVYEATPRRPYDGDTLLRRRMLNRVDPLPAVYRRLRRRVDRVNLRSASTVLVNSRFTARAVERLYQVEARVSYHGVDTAKFHPIGGGKRHNVLSVGSLTPLKGFDFLVRAMAEYPAAGRPTLVLASNFANPPERDYLQHLARDSGVDLVLAGCVDDAELVSLYNQAKAVVYAPIREPFGLVPLEAMACATPVVAVAEGGIPETVLDGQTGFLTERDPGHFAAAVRRLVDDPALARKLGENGREHVLSHWSWDSAVRSLEAHLDTAVRTRSVATSRRAASTPTSAERM